MAGFSDIEQRLCLGLALWNGRDPILKERMFGLTGAQGNHGEDVKEYWWYLDAVPSHAWNRWRYHYPQGAFPYDDLIAENAPPRASSTPSTSCSTPGVFDDDRYWIVEVDYAKADPDRPADDGAGHQRRPRGGHAARAADGLVPQHLVLGRRRAEADAGAPDGRDDRIDDRPPVPRAARAAGRSPDPTAPTPTPLFCENETNTARLYGAAPATPYPKDGINDHVVAGADTVNPDRRGHQGVVLVPARRSTPGATVELRLRLRPAGSKPRKAGDALGADFDAGGGRAPGRGRRVLRRADPGRRRRRRGRGHAPGLRRDAVEQAALRLRRRPLARRRPDPAAPAGRRA